MDTRDTRKQVHGCRDLTVSNKTASGAASKVARVFLLALLLSKTMALADTPVASSPTTSSGYSGLGADSLSREEVARYAPSPLDAQTSRRIQALLDVRGSRAGYTTSRGARQVYTSRLTGIDQVFRQDGPMQFPIQLTGGEDRTSVVGLAPDDSFIVVSRDVGGEENPGLYLLSLSGGPLRVVQHTTKVQTQLQYVSDDSRSLVFRANDRAPASYVLYRYDITSGQRELMFTEEGLWSVADHRGNEQWLLTKDLGNTHQEIYEYDLRTKKLSPVLGQGEVAEYQVAYGKRPGQILVLTSKLGDFSRLYVLESGKLTPVTPDVRHDVEGFAIDDARHRIYYQVNEDGYWRLFVLDAGTFRAVALPKLTSSESIQLDNVSHDGRFAELVLDGSTQVPQTVTCDWQTGKATAWRAPSLPEVDDRAFAKAELMHYPARDGTPIPMLVRRPAKCAGVPCPVIVDFHGGPESQARPVLSILAQSYVDAGFVYVQPNVRGSSGYGKVWLHADDGPKRLVVITDIEDAARFIRARWGKDGHSPKIGVFGTSYGGYSALMAMTYFAGAYDAGVEQVGISNLVSFLANTAPYRRALRISEYGDPVKDHDALIQLSPITHVSKIRGPLLVIGGLNDPRVPIGESVQIHRELERRKVPTELIIFSDEGHGAIKRGNVVLMIGHSIAFFKKHLLGEPAN